MRFGPPIPLHGMMTTGCGRSGAGGPSYSDEVVQFFDRVAPYPTGDDADLYVALIDGLVADGVWSKLEVLQIYAAVNEATGVENLVSALYAANPENLTTSLTWTAYTGYSSPDLSRVSTGFIMKDGSIYTQNDAFAGIWTLDGTQRSQSELVGGPADSATESDELVIYPKWSDTKMYGDIACTTNMGAVNAGNSAGWFVVERTASNAQRMLRNDTQLQTGSTASAAYTANYYAKVKARHGIAAFACGSHLSTAEHTALYDRLTTFLTGVGAL